MHSTDIAFKPNDSGWGYSPQYSSNFDRIFGKKMEKKENLDLEDVKRTLRRIVRDHGTHPEILHILEAEGWYKLKAEVVVLKHDTAPGKD